MQVGVNWCLIDTGRKYAIVRERDKPDVESSVQWVVLYFAHNKNRVYAIEGEYPVVLFLGIIQKFIYFRKSILSPMPSDI